MAQTTFIIPPDAQAARADRIYACVPSREPASSLSEVAAREAAKRVDTLTDGTLIVVLDSAGESIWVERVSVEEKKVVSLSQAGVVN